ncbi:MAG: adventurous gliding motility protein GltC [Myxococcales bacterium]|nr:adventurous gliding motility protein GltC [Myxococcales bacterium]
MRRNLLALAIALAYALPSTVAHAQMSFEGLDLGGKKKKKKKEKKAGDKDEEKGEETPAATTDAPLPEGGLDLTKPADAKKAEKPAPTMSFEAVDVSGKSADRQRLEVALTHFKNEAYEQAALASHELMQDPKLAGLHLEAQYLLAKSLYRMGMYHSSLGEFSRVLAKGPSTKFFKTSLEWLFFISHKTTNETVILDEIAKYANFEFPEQFRSEFHYLLARYYFVRGRALDEIERRPEADKSFEEVRRLVMMVPKGDPFYPKAKYLEGLAYFRDGKPETALQSMKDVVRVTRRPPGPMTQEARLNQQLRELAFMQLARTHYGARQNRYAIHYFSKVERGNPQWLEALFEASWANYRVGQYEQGLGNLITLSSPFFRDEYFPEALILKAVVYFENCRYRESGIILEDFERIYGPVHEQLQMLVDKKLDSSEYYTILLDIQKKNKEGLEKNSTDLILERVLKLALTDQDLRKTNDSILELEGEIDAMSNKGDAFKYSDVTKTLIEGLKTQREQLIKKAGVMTQGKLEFELGQLKQLLANALRIRFETTSKEKEYLEIQLQEEGRKEVVRPYKFSPAVGDEELYWPFNGEYWRDELGTYHYTLTKGCIERAAGVQSASAGGP